MFQLTSHIAPPQKESTKKAPWKMLVSHLVEISWKNTRLPKGFESHVDVLTAAEIAVGTGLLQMRWKAPEARLCWWKESCTFPFTSRLPMKNLGLSNWLNLFRSHAPAKGLLIMNEFMFPAVRTPQMMERKRSQSCWRWVPLTQDVCWTQHL